MPPGRPQIFDFRTARLRRSRLQDGGFLFTAAGEGLGDRLATVTRRFAHGLAIGAAPLESIRPFAQDWTTAEFDSEDYLPVAPASVDLAVSVFSLQAVNDLPGALIQIRRALKPDGLFLAALFGGATLQELRDSFAHAELEILGGVSPRVSPFGDVRDMGHLLQRAGFALPVADVERSLVRYNDFARLVGDLRAHGQTNVMAGRSRKFLRRDTLAALLSHYSRHHTSDGKLNATFDILYLTGWAPHESQQQPLKPGSAQTRLADVLGVKEHKT